MFELAPLLLVLPLLGWFINSLVGRRFILADRTNGERWTGWLAAGLALATFGISLALLFAVRAQPEGAIVTLFDWIYIPSADFRIPWALQIDTLSTTMLMVVTGVGSLIHIYAIGYMHGDRDFNRFFAYLNLFLFFMIILVTGSSYLVLFVGWEGVGLCSFLLIGFWFAKERKIGGEHGIYEGVQNANAARKAFVANRVGDLAMILAMSLLFWAFGSLEFRPIFEEALHAFETGEAIQLTGTVSVGVGGLLTAVTALFLAGAAGKSAQIPLFVWLPDAMAGPTPVSALIHAATMVTSGIYLIVRSNVLFEIVRASDATLAFGISSPELVAIVGSLTALYAGLIAFTAFDIKKVLAYSTVSQLGFMVAAVGMGAYVAGMFHLITHAFFKALLFMSAGSVIHGMEHGHHHAHEHHAHDAHGGHDAHGTGHHAKPAHAHVDKFDPQDMRYMGGLLRKMPVTAVVYIVGALALAGIFPFAGFWSKDEILAHAARNSGGTFTFVYWMLTLAAICTAFYMGRQIKMVFFGKPRHEAADYASESPQVMTRPLVILAALALLGGFLNLPHATEAGYKAYSAAHAGEHSEEEAAHGDEEAHGAEVAAAETGAYREGLIPNLELEHWLEHSIESFHLTEEGILHMPHTPTWVQYDVAIISTVLALLAAAGSFLFVYGKRPQTSTEEDPIFRVPGFRFLSRLPLDTFYMKGLVPLFNRVADYTAHRVDWAFYHDWFHDIALRGNFIRFSNWLSGIFDARVVDYGMVLGTGRFVRGISGLLRQAQSGYVRNYALGLFLGVVALMVYFLFLG